jgi:hypothetical protein
VLASFGKVGTKTPIYCRTHVPKNDSGKIDNTYINLKNKHCYLCDKRAYYNFAGLSPEFCNNHKGPDMVRNSTRPKKSTSSIDEARQLGKNYRTGKCTPSMSNNEVNNEYKIRKEIEIAELLFIHDFEFKHDKVIEKGISKRRPDFVLDSAWGKIVLEVDEFQHKRKGYTDDMPRMKEICLSLQTENILFIRYNPDEYEPVEGHIILNKPEREDFLLKTLKRYMQIHVDKHNIIYLFYDGFDQNDIEPVKFNVD